MAWWSSPRRSRREQHAGFDPSDLAEMEALEARIVNFDEQWETQDYAIAELLVKELEPVAWYMPQKEHLVYNWVQRMATDGVSYLRIRAQLQKDYDTFVAAVERADDDGVIDYSHTGSYFTVTRQDRRRISATAAATLWPVIGGELLSLKAGRGPSRPGSLVVVSARRGPGRRGPAMRPPPPGLRARLRAAGMVGLPGGRGTSGPFRFRPIEGYNPANPLKRGPHGGYIDRFGNEWVRGPAHGRSAAEGHAYEWDVRLSARGVTVWGQYAKRGADGQLYVNVTPTGYLANE